MILNLMLAALVTAGQPVNPPEGDENAFSERQPVRLELIPEDRAFAAFRDICMATGFDSAAFNRAAEASDMGFVAAEEPEDDSQEWSSRHGQFVLRVAPDRDRLSRREAREGLGIRRRWVARCDYWVGVRENQTPEALIDSIGRALAPQVRPQEEILGTSWELAPDQAGTTLKLVYLPSNDDPRLFTLSLQRLAEPTARDGGRPGRPGR